MLLGQSKQGEWVCPDTYNTLVKCEGDKMSRAESLRIVAADRSVYLKRIFKKWDVGVEWIHFIQNRV
jgi:hypothetical protein